ncbi:MAG: hypothetical protein II897_07485 [Clostridia bacterium]|nr:hypothetical protein [Clostridia bacterium]
MKRILALMLAAAALLCFAGCMSRFPIGKRGNVTLRFYTEPIPESMVPVNDGSLIGSTMNLTVSDSATVRRYINSIRKWTDDTAVDREEYVFIGEISVENNLGVCYFTEDGIVFYRNALDRFSGKLSKSGLEFIMIFYSRR